MRKQGKYDKYYCLYQSLSLNPNNGQGSNAFIIIYNISFFKVMGFSSDAIDTSRPSTTTANSVEDYNDGGSSFSSAETGGGGQTRTNL